VLGLGIVKWFPSIYAGILPYEHECQNPYATPCRRRSSSCWMMQR